MEFNKIYVLKGRVIKHTSKNNYSIYIKKSKSDISEEELEKLVGKDVLVIVLFSS